MESLTWMTNHPPSVLWLCCLGHQTCKISSQVDLIGNLNSPSLRFVCIMERDVIACVLAYYLMYKQMYLMDKLTQR